MHGDFHLKQTGMLVVSLRGVNLFGKFGLSREKLRYSISTIIIVNVIGFEYYLGHRPVFCSSC